MTYYSAEREDENLTGNIRNKLVYLRSAAGQQVLFEMKEHIIAVVDTLHAEVRGGSGCPRTMTH
jgi:RNA-dependent RNA polymerase